MKKIVFRKLRILFLFVAALAVVTSCKKETKNASTQTCSGKPVITKISSTTDRAGDTPGGSLSDWIIIQGTNLCGAKSIMFNDVQVDLSKAYITPTEITVAIPRGIPTVVNNMVTLNTGGGDATFGYKVSVPALQVTGMYNEYTPNGATMAIVGKNFDLYELNKESGKVIFDGTEVAIERSTADSIFFKVPLAAVVNAKLSLKDKRGIVTPVPGQYKDNRGMVYDMEQTNYWNYAATPTSNKFTTQNGPVPAPISGKYAVWKGAYSAWVWNETFHVVWNPKLADIGVIGSANNYVIKFEINTLKEWAKDPLNIKLLNIVATWQPYTNLPFQSYGWKTVTIPLSIFKVNGVPIDITQAQANAATELRAYIHGPDNVDFDLAIDNFRIVPKN